MFFFFLFELCMWVKRHKNKCVSRYLSERLPELTLMLDIHYMVPRSALDKSVPFNRRFSKTSHEPIRPLSPKYRKSSDHCKCPKILSMFLRGISLLWQRIQSLKKKQGECRRELLICMLEGENTTNALKPPNPVFKIVRSHAGTRKAVTPSVSSRSDVFTPAMGPHSNKSVS